MLQIRNLVAHAGAFRLCAEDFTTHQGAIVALIGPSGGGKSTFLRAIAGFQAIDSGQIILGGRGIENDPAAGRGIAMLFQDNNLFPHLTIKQNVGLGISPSLRLNTAQQANVRSALAAVGLEGFEERLPGALSGGQQGRAALARVLVQERSLWLLDEPFAALGPAMRADMMRLVERIANAQGATVLFVSHHPDDARKTAKFCAFVADGIVGEAMETAPLFANPSEALRSYLG